MDFLEIYWTDVYKTGHKAMLPTGSTLMFSNRTPRSGKHSNCPNDGHIITIGGQKLVRQMKEDWQKNFFDRPLEEVYQFGRDMTDMLMLSEPFDVSHMVALHQLGYLPIRVKSIEEGSRIPYKIPDFTIVNTVPLDGGVYDWIVNYLETILNAESWQMPTSATLAFEFRKLGKTWIEKTDPENMWFLDYQFHDFSMRGMGGKSAIVNSGLGFASSSKGSDTLAVIPASRKYYDETDVCVNSVIASEHAIMCTLTGFFLKKKDGSWEKIGDLEVETFRYLLETFPTGILSLVSDTWDLWRVITDYCKQLKDVIMARDGKLVIRPDSGDPVDIICGKANLVMDGTYYFETGDINSHQVFGDYKREELSVSEGKGVIELLWDIFGGEETSTGYKRLDSHVGCIYGDAINYDRAIQIFERLEAKGFATTNIVLGVGSYSLQYVTRDTHGFAQKATYVEVNIDGVVHGIDIFKDPITDDGTKKSAKGLLMVYKDEQGAYHLKDQCTWEEEAQGELQIIFEDGKFFNETTLTEIRARIDAHLV